eukprot:CAMPEP_0118892530 /NCGR_PEP_ID=MMETSP1166-20130328/2083_1 /TAXON_ID=1104430 /ORGANISM="Chrysoreinhardia sp, Strain CCMP3193" /LENGTH=141 /DNA_ID=CAMNT_0006831265 /DNA_START=161 /DNA_END=586 /DNA_ORIENTATION=-
MAPLRVLALATSALAFTAPSSQTHQTTTRVRPLASVAPPREASELLEKADVCAGGACEWAEVVALRSDLSDTLEQYDSTIKAYDVGPEDDDVHYSGAEVEDHALRKYVHKLRLLHTAIADKLKELDTLLAKVNRCQKVASM